MHFSQPEKVQDFLSGTQNLRFETLSWIGNTIANAIFLQYDPTGNQT